MLSIDSTFITNKNGVEKIGRNVFYKNKRGRKITAIVDEKGIPTKINLTKGNKHDSRIAPKIISKLSINKSKEEKFILADKGYDSNKIRELIKNKGYKLLIVKTKNLKRDI